MGDKLIRLYGKVTDFKDNAIKEANVKILDKRFESLYETQTNENGEYQLNVKPDMYGSFFACKDYGISNLQYWAWNVPVLKEMELNAKIDALQVYAINAFEVQGAAPNKIMLYFRPMSLKKIKAIKESSEIETVEIFDIAPKLTKEDIEVLVNTEKVEVFEINQIFESGSNNEKYISYLVHVSFPKYLNKCEYNKITITLFDNETYELGQGSLFWKAN